LVPTCRPKRRNFVILKLRLSARQPFHPPCPTFGLMARMVEKQIPDKAAEFTRCLCIRKSRLVFNKWLDLLGDLAYETFEIAALRRPVGVDFLKQRSKSLIKAERFGALFLCDLRRHQQGKEDA